MQSLSTEQFNSEQDSSSNQVLPTSEDDLALRKAERALIARLKKTQKEIRRVDLFTAICAFFTLGLGLFLFGIVCDHWILPNGFSVRGRLCYVVFWIVSTSIFFILKLAPTFRRRVNPLYAAKVLEEELQDDYNLTINWFQLCRGVKKDKKRGEPEKWQDEAIRQAVLREVTIQAVNRARQKKEEETSVDCSSLIRWGVALACVVALCSGYVVCSPKNPFTSAQRIVAPFAEIERPQALRFESVDPGDAVVFQGDFLEVTADVPGANSSSVELLYSTEDRRLVDMVVPMESQGSTTFSAKIPNDELGFSENLTYQIVVGRGRQIESRSDSFHIEVKPQPSFRVEKTTLYFPEYTGLESQTFENQGDVRALEGTQVEIVARANGQLERAFLLPDGSETGAQKMQISKDSPYLATKRFELKLNGEKCEAYFDGVAQDVSFYRIISQDVDGEKNRDVQDYTVSVFADLPPNIRWETAIEKQVEVPLNDVLRLKVWAEDPDFSLVSIQLTTSFHDLDEEDRKQTRSNPPSPIELLKKKTSVRTASNYVGPQTLDCEISPEKLGLQVGDVLECWCVAFDSKVPEPNTASTEKLLFVVVDPVANPTGVVPQEEQEEDSGSDSAGQDGAGDGSGSDEQQESGENAESSNQNNGEDSEENSSQSSNGNSGEESNQENGEDSNESDNSGNNSQESGNGEDSNEAGSQKSDPNDPSGAKENSSGSDASSQENQEQNPNGQSSEGTNSSDDQSDGSEQGNEQSSNDSNGSSPAERSAEQSDDQSNASQDPAASGAEQDSIDPETNPGDAFEKILDRMNQEKKSSDSNDPKTSSSDDESMGSGAHSGDPSDAAPAGEQGRNSEEETVPDFQSDEEIPTPEEKKKLPTRTSPEKPKEDSPSYKADAPDKIDPNTKRRQDELDPETNDFLAQNADPDASNSDPKSKNNDANVAFDPLDQSEGVAADSIDRNAQEAKGAPNSSASDAPYEVDDEQQNDDRQNSPNNNSISMNDLPQDALGGGGGSGDDKRSGETSNTNDPQGGSGDNKQNSNDRSQQDGNSSQGKSDQNAERQGGGGGSGTGELGSSEQSLAPADAPKLQYAEQATNLVLDYLEESLKDKVDPDLLDELGWTEKQLREFLERWKKMRDDAYSNDASKERYLNALRNAGLENRLGFEDVSDAPSQGRERDPEQRKADGVREASRLKTPERLDERVRAFTRGVAQKKASR